jgi:hypothetical protein
VLYGDATDASRNRVPNLRGDSERSAGSPPGLAGKLDAGGVGKDATAPAVVVVIPPELAFVAGKPGIVGRAGLVGVIVFVFVVTEGVALITAIGGGGKPPEEMILVELVLPYNKPSNSTSRWLGLRGTWPGVYGRPLSVVACFHALGLEEVEKMDGIRLRGAFLSANC